MKYKLFILGRTNAGKDTIARLISERNNLKVLASYTDIPKRCDQTDGVEHTFISKKQMDDILENEKLFDTYISSRGRYCATLNQVQKSDIYIINPYALLEAVKQYGQSILDNVIIIFIDQVFDECRKRADRRGDNLDAFYKRWVDEYDEYRNLDMMFYDNRFIQIINNNIEDTYDFIMKAIKYFESEE